MQAGVDIIVQAALSDDNWFGRADVLRKVERPSGSVIGRTKSTIASLPVKQKQPQFFSCRSTPKLVAIQGVLPEFNVCGPAR